MEEDVRWGIMAIVASIEALDCSCAREPLIVLPGSVAIEFVTATFVKRGGDVSRGLKSAIHN